MPLDFILALFSRIPYVEMTCFDRMNEVFVRRNNRFIRILGWVDSRVSGRKTISHASPKLNGASLRSDLTYCLFGLVPISCFTSDSIINGAILQVLGHTSANAKIRG